MGRIIATTHYLLLQVFRKKNSKHLNSYFLISSAKFDENLYKIAFWYILKKRFASFFTFSAADSKITFAIDPFNAGSLMSNSFSKLKQNNITVVNWLKCFI